MAIPAIALYLWWKIFRSRRKDSRFLRYESFFFKNHQKAFDFIRKKILKEHRGYFFWTLFSLFVSSAIGVLLPYLAKLEIDQLVAKNSTLFSLFFFSDCSLWHDTFLWYSLQNFSKAFFHFSSDSRPVYEIDPRIRAQERDLFSYHTLSTWVYYDGSDFVV